MSHHPVPPPRRKYGAQALCALVPGMMAPILQQRGFASATILTQWAEIVGPHIAKWTTPLEIRWPKLGKGADHPTNATGKAVLIIACPGAFALDVQNAEKTIIEAVNRRFGWACIAAIRISQQPRPAPKTPVERKKLSEAEIAIISDGLGDIAEPNLRQALAELGAAIAKRQSG